MASFSSPEVRIVEKPVDTVVPGVSSSVGAHAGVSRWGPVGKPVLLDSETSQVKRFGKPTDFNAETFFTLSSFFAYGDAAYFVRAANTTGTSPIVTANIVSGNTTVEVGNTASLSNGMVVHASALGSVKVGTTISVTNSTHIALSSAADALSNTTSESIQFVSPGSAYTAFVNTASVSNLSGQIVRTEDEFVTKFEDDDFDSDVQYIARWPGELGNSLKISVCDSSEAFSSNVDLTSNGTFDGSLSFVVDSNTAAVSISVKSTSNTFDLDDFNDFVSSVSGSLTVGDYIIAGNSSIGTQGMKVTSVTSAAEVSLSSNSGTSANLTSGNTTLTTTSNAFSGLSNGDFIAIYANSSAYSVIRIDEVTDGNTVVLTTDLGVTNASVTWASVDDPTANIALTFEDKFKRSQNTSSNTISRTWEYYDSFSSAPGQSEDVLRSGNTSANDEMHVVVVDEDGKFSGVAGTILERYSNLSRATNAKGIDGTSIYYKTVINQSSEYVWSINDRSGAVSNTVENISSSTNDDPLTKSFSLGRDGYDESTVSIGDIATAYDTLSNKETIDISLIMQGKARGGTAGGQLANYLIDNLAESRKDCVVFVSPTREAVVNNSGFEADDIVSFRNTLRSSSYAFLDSGYKYMYDRYNDVYRYIPLNGDMAGLAARTDVTNDPWWSFAGLTRGRLKNVVRLAYNPRKADRDLLYNNGVNPVVTFPADGTVLFGDKTLQAKPGAFDRINVRRLFITIEKAIERAAKYTLFEFNDAFTRASFRNLIIPYLRDVQGRRGIIDSVVICDDTNNTPTVIDRNEFVGDIYIKPNKSINYIQINFIPVAGSLSFTEVIGNI